MACETQQMHFILFPFMAQGHMIPMLDIARLLAKNGVIVTVITTPVNANRITQILDRAVKSGLLINLIELKFPTEEAGLPQECENLDMLSSLGLGTKFFCATKLLQEQALEVLEVIKPRPNCIISDMTLPYTGHIATKLQIPRITFNGLNCLCMLLMHKMRDSMATGDIYSESEYFSVPGMDPRIQLTKQQLPGAFIQSNDDFNAEIVAAEATTCGIIFNSFEELELETIHEYQKVREDYKVWCIGPVSLNNKDNLDLIQRGDKASTQESNRCLKWLDEKKPGSVIYVCFGSLCNLVTLQMIELASGLEASNKPFIWAIRGGGKSKDLEKWMEEVGFEERTNGRSLIIRGWAPQLAILSHKAVAGFLTHCGWNSTLEAISAGVPMVTWPLFADQFCNEKLVVDVLKIGVKVGAEVTVVWGEEDKIGVTVKREDVAKAVMKLMEEEEEGEERRKRSKELSEKAKKAVEPDGSSYLNLKHLVEDIKQLAKIKN